MSDVAHPTNGCHGTFFWYSGRHSYTHIMKTGIHPENYRDVIFHDNSSGERFLFGSTIETEATDTWEDGKEYPIAYVEVSSASHPFYTGTEKVMDTAGRVEKFKARAASAGGRTKKAANKTEKAKKGKHDNT